MSNGHDQAWKWSMDSPFYVLSMNTIQKKVYIHQSNLSAKTVASFGASSTVIPILCLPRAQQFFRYCRHSLYWTGTQVDPSQNIILCHLGPFVDLKHFLALYFILFLISVLSPYMVLFLDKLSTSMLHLNEINNCNLQGFLSWTFGSYTSQRLFETIEDVFRCCS